MTPYILLGRKRLPLESPPSSAEHLYDEQQQLWIDKMSGLPLVSVLRRQTQATQFGETSFTETREGADQPEGTVIQATQYGETTLTKTREGSDQMEGTGVLTTQFGETILTRSREGADQTEGSPLQGLDAFNYNI
jgi:hypothetical protein